MAIASSPVADGQTATAAHYNNLRDDVLTNHTHASGGGGAVDHADLSESGAMTGQHHTHTNIETHMNGSDESFDDVGGGDQGVHGLGSGLYVVGSYGSQILLAGGTGTLSGSTVTVSTGYSFGSYISIQVTFKQDKTGADHYPTELYIENENAGLGQFDVTCSTISFDNAAFYWMVMGTAA